MLDLNDVSDKEEIIKKVFEAKSVKNCIKNYTSKPLPIFYTSVDEVPDNNRFYFKYENENCYDLVKKGCILLSIYTNDLSSITIDNCELIKLLPSKRVYINNKKYYKCIPFKPFTPINKFQTMTFKTDTTFIVKYAKIHNIDNIPDITEYINIFKKYMSNNQ